MSEPLACVICGCVPELAFPVSDLMADDPGQPYGATVFIAYGQYGSTVFDPPPYAGLPSTYLQLNICDQCLVRAAQRKQVLLVDKTTSVQHNYRPWNGGGETNGESD